MALLVANRGLVLLIIAVASTLAMTGLDLELLTDPRGSEHPRAVLVRPFRDLPRLGQFTFCFWVNLKKSENMRHVSLVSYSSREAGQTNEILFDVDYPRNRTGLWVGDVDRFIAGVPAPDKWTHVCAEWSSRLGEVYLFFDGRHSGTAQKLRQGYVIKGDGFLVLGNDQDQYDGGYSSSDGITGKITQFQFFDRLLGSDEVRSVMNCQLKGNLIQWENSTWRLADNAMTAPTTTPCGTCALSTVCNAINDDNSCVNPLYKQLI